MEELCSNSISISIVGQRNERGEERGERGEGRGERGMRKDTCVCCNSRASIFNSETYTLDHGTGSIGPSFDFQKVN